MSFQFSEMSDDELRQIILNVSTGKDRCYSNLQGANLELQKRAMSK